MFLYSVRDLPECQRAVEDFLETLLTTTVLN